MKILWHSVAPWVGTGYGMQTAQAIPRIQKLGHDVAISAYYGLAGSTMDWHGIKVYPQYAEQYGIDVVVPHALDHFGAGVGDEFSKFATAGWIFTLTDVWVMQAPLLPDMSVAAWVPIDHETIPPRVREWFHQTNAVPIAMSKFGRDKLIEFGMEHTLYVPHAIDTGVFYPGDKAEAREACGLPTNAFVVAIVAANVGKDSSRKAFFEQVLAFAELRRRHPDAVLALHTDIGNRWGVDLRVLLADLPKNSYVVSDQYAYRVGTPASKIAEIYRAADVLSNTSWGEGFGVPIVESQACGTPVIVTDTTAMPELVGAGWKVPGEPLWHESQQAWARRPLIGSIIDAYDQAYEHARSDDMRAQAWAFAQQYDADTVAETYWKPALDKLDTALSMRAADVAASKPRLHTSIREAPDGTLWIDRGRTSGDAIGFADHEPEIGALLADLLPEGGVLLDVGAHVGHHAIRLSRKASRVFAVEANPETAKTLRKNIVLNDVDNIQVLEFAAWDEDTTLVLDDPNDQTAGGSTRTVIDGDGRIVNARRLDEDPNLMNQFVHVDLVKMDVEGADLHVLRGMKGLLDRHRPVLLIECHDVYGYYARAELETTLTGLGYRFEVAHTVPTQWMPDGNYDTVRYADYLLCRPMPLEG